MEERLQKILAQAGLGSRRGCEELIRAGRVLVNGQVATLGMKATPQTDQIHVDGEPLKTGGAPIYLMLNKPRGVLSAAYSPEGRQTVVDLINLPTRVYPVGRLDIDSEGLILLTNDGELTNKLTHPRYEHEKEYRVLVGRRPDEEQLQAWRRGIVLEDGFRTSPADVRLDKVTGDVAWLTVVLKEGHKRQIREMGASTGLPVLQIIRVRMGSLQLGTLKSKEWRYLTAEEIQSLKNPAADKKPTKPGKPGGLRAPYRNRREREDEQENRPPRKPFGKFRPRRESEDEQENRPPRKPYKNRDANPGSQDRPVRAEGYRPRREREDEQENHPPRKPYKNRDANPGSQDRPPRRPGNRGKPSSGTHKPFNKRKP